MSNVLGELGGIAGKSAGEALAFGLGFALGRVLEPVGTALVQTAWQEDPLRAPDAATLAEGVAQGQVDPGKAAEWASMHGFGEEQFNALVSIANAGPALGYAFAAWRRGELTDEGFTTALRRTGLEERWDDAMRALKDERLDLGAIATAVHRGIMRGQDLIVTEPPTGSGRIPRPPASTISPTDEAAAHGIDHERLRVLIANTGLPLALGEMLRLLNMGKVTEDDVRIAVAESNIRNEYMDAALDLRRRLVTPHEYAEGRVRGLKTTPELHAGAALSGMESADADFLYELLGRPLAVRAITTGLARGGKYGGDYAGVPEPFLDAIRRSSIRPEYGNLAYANRYTYPSAFVLRALASAHTLTENEVHEILLEIGWRPDLAAKVSADWATGGTAKADPHVTRAQTALFTAMHKSFVAEESDAAAVQPGLAALEVPADAQARVLALWQHERDLIRAQLTPTQVKKAYTETKYTRDEAIAKLLARGFALAEANVLLDE